MNPQTVINIATGVVIGSTALTLTATLMYFWKRYQVQRRDAKLPHVGSRQPTLDPDRSVDSADEDADQPDTDLVAAGLDPDRPTPPPVIEADEPDAIEEEVRHG